MSVDRKEIDLIIRAALQGGKTLDGVAKSITDIEKALEAQAAAAKRGESSIDELRATLLALQRVQDQLKDQAGLIGQYQRLSQQIATSADKVAEATRKHEEYRDKLNKTGTATDYQANKLIKLANAAERNQTTLTKQRAEQEALGKALQDAGVQIDNLAAAENKARLSAAQLGVTISRTQDAISTYADDVRKARDEARKLAEDRTFEQKLADAARLNKASEYVRFWTESLNQAELAEQQMQIKTALRETADEAVAAARGYKTLGTAAKSLTGSSNSLRGLVQGIVDPAATARESLAGVETEIRSVADAAAAAKAPLENYRGQVQQLVAAQKSITEKAGLVDAFSRQIASLRQARAEFVQARTTVLQYADALRNSTGQNDQLQASLQRAQTALAAAQKNLAQQLVTTRSMRDAVAQAGLSTNNLAASQARLTSAAQSSVAALNQLNAAHDKYGDAVNRSANGHDFFSNSGRTTLSWMQRIRGELLSLVAAYVGLYAAIDGSRKAIDAFNVKQGIQNQLAISAGNDNAKIAEEYKYIREQADRIGLSFESAAKGYAKFSAAAKLAGRDSQEIRYIFETFSEVGRVAQLSSDDLDGVFRALEQIISKGTIQAEELRGQLGDRLFGAFQIAAQALKDQFPQLDKAMKDGKVTADQLVKIAEKYKETVGPRLSQATQSLTANQARLNSAIFDFKVLVAEQGFADEYAKLVERLTTFFQSDDGTQFAKDLSDGLTAIAKILVALVENAELVKQTLIVGVLVLGARSAAGFAVSMLEAGAAVGVLSAEAEILAARIAFIKKAFAVVAAAAAGWEIGTILYEKFEVVRQVAQSIVAMWDGFFTSIKYGAKILWAELPAIFADGVATIGNVLTKGFREMLGVFSSTARAIGKNDLADSIDKAASAIEFRTGRVGNASKQLREQMTRDLNAIKEIGLDIWREGQNPGSTVKKSPAAATAKPTNVKKGKSADDEKDAEKRLKIKEQLENELTALEAKIERNEKESLERRLQAIDLTYTKLANRIRKLGGAEAAEMEARLARDIGELKAQETRKFNEALLKEQTDLQRKLEQIDAQAGRNTKTDLDKRLEAVRLQHEQTYREIAEFRDKLVQNNRDTTPADLMKDRLDAGLVAIQNLERQKYYEDALNAVLEERKAKIDTINVMEKTGLLTAVQARERAAEVVNQTQPRIEALVAEGLQYVDVMMQAAEATGANTTALETLKAKLIEAKESGKGLRTEFLSAAQANEMLANGASTAFQTAAEAIGGAIVGLNSWKDAILATRNAFLKFAADFLMQIAQMILKQALLNALQSSSGGGGVGGIIASAVNALVKHEGGVVGSGGPSRMVSPTLFAGAPRYHGGGIPGLAPDEYPAILKKNEEVLTQNDPRNVLNGGMAGGATAQPIKIINAIDSASVVTEGLSTQPGEKAVLNVVRANRAAIKQMLG